jgi:hypothetical protein
MHIREKSVQDSLVFFEEQEVSAKCHRQGPTTSADGSLYMKAPRSDPAGITKPAFQQRET